MNYLLDTHVLIWFVNGDKSLPTKVKHIIESEKNFCYISIASIWEITIKLSLNKLKINTELSNLQLLLSEMEIEILPINIEDLIALKSLKFHHKDPFDRMIVAQAKTQELSIISIDKEFKKYGVKLLWD